MERYSNISFADFNSKFLHLLGKHVPVKKRYIKTNQKIFMDKELIQAIMVRSKLGNQILKLKSEEKLFWKTVSPLFTEKASLRTTK